MGVIRLFIAIETPPDIKSQLADVQSELRAAGGDVKWESSQKFHATLKFLGATDESLLPNIISSMEEIGKNTSPLHLKYTGVGCFPSNRDPKVIWVGIEDPTGELTRLVDSIETEMESFGFKKEIRRFHPHVTLGRVKGPRNLRNLRDSLETVTFEHQSASIREIVVVKSELKQNGSEYTFLKSVQLSL